MHDYIVLFNSALINFIVFAVIYCYISFIASYIESCIEDWCRRGISFFSKVLSGL